MVLQDYTVETARYTVGRCPLRLRVAGSGALTRSVTAWWVVADSRPPGLHVRAKMALAGIMDADTEKGVQKMLISQTKYNDAGELLAPHPALVAMKAGLVEDVPTVDRGAYHYFEMRSRTEADQKVQVERFLATLDAVGGKILSAKEEKYLAEDITTFVYVVEDPARVRETAKIPART